MNGGVIMGCRASLRWSGGREGLEALLGKNAVSDAVDAKKSARHGKKADRHLKSQIFKVKKTERQASGKKTGPRKKVTKFYKNREQQFLMLWNAMAPESLPKPVAQHRFHATRRHRLDWAWPDYRVGVEIHGGVFLKKATGHRSISGVSRDLLKGNLAVASGWRVLCFQANDLDRNPSGTIQMVVDLLMGR